MTRLISLILALALPMSAIASVRVVDHSKTDRGVVSEIYCGYGVNCATTQSGRLVLGSGVLTSPVATQLDETQCGQTILSTGNSTFTLPGISIGQNAGCVMTFIVGASNNLKIFPANLLSNSRDQILTLTTGAGQSIYANTLGASIRLQSIGTSTWAIQGKEQGTWSR